MGPGATWKPFRISAKEYKELLPLVLSPNRDDLRKFARYPDQQLFIETDFDHVRDHVEWVVAVAGKHGGKNSHKTD
jgi:hypothetical protein